MSDQHEGDPRDIEPAYASDDWASRRGYEIAMAWGDSHEHRLGQADDIAHEFRKLRDYMQAQIDALRQELATREREWTPVEYEHIYTEDARPIRLDYKNICEKWYDFNAYASDTDDGYEYTICRKRTEQEEDDATT